MPKQVAPVDGILQTLWNDLRGQGVFWLVMLPITAAGALFAVLAKQAWGVSPWLTGGIAACLLLSLVGLISMWRGTDDWNKLRERRQSAYQRAEVMRNTLLKFERISAHSPLKSNKPTTDHQLHQVVEWISLLVGTKADIRYWRDESWLPQDIASLVRFPTTPPYRPDDTKLGEDSSESRLYELQHCAAGMREALVEYCRRERVKLSLPPVADT